MAWTYYCDMDGQTLMATTKEELASKVMQHVNKDHDMNMTMDQAMESVEQNAKQSAA